MEREGGYEWMSDTSVGTDFLQSLQIFTEFVIKSVGKELWVLSIDNILLSVEEPFGDFVLSGVLEDCDDTFEFFSSEFSSTKSSVSTHYTSCRSDVPFVEIHISLTLAMRFKDIVWRVPSWWRCLSIVDRHPLFWSMQTWSSLSRQRWCWEDGECAGRHSCRGLREPWLLMVLVVMRVSTLYGQPN